MDRRTDTQACQRGTLPAGEAEKEHLPAGLRSGHGFCESGAPLTPVAGQEGVPGSANGSGESQMVQNIIT
ncbi:hypothetical protein PBY51_017015 [Eleginops maclovinus]|nr:hypothetical protein PBY51_017015 [Eleginops maclovinus]